MNNLQILKVLLSEEEETRMEPAPKTFEDDPMSFILNKYQNLNEILIYLLGTNFKEYLTGIYIIADKPTEFKIVLHNGQYFFLTFMGEAYEATVSGKTYFLLTIGEKQRCILAIKKLLRWGSPLKTKGAEGAEQSGTEETPEETPTETPAEPEEGGEETLAEVKQTKILESLLELKVSGQKAEVLAVQLWNAAVNGKQVPAKFKSVYKEIQEISKNYKTEIKKFSGRKEPTTKFWQTETGKAADEPKTDLISVDEKILRLSAKKGPAQLMSAAPKEAKATVLAAAKSSGLDTETKDKLMTMMKGLANSTKTEKLNTGDLKKTDLKNIKSEVNIKAKKVIDKATKVQNELQKELRDLFSSNPKFKIAFAYEAMTGKQKFGNNTPGEANYVIAFSNDFQHVKFEDISKISSPVVKSIADKCNLSVSFKSSSYKSEGKKAGYNFFSAIRVGLEDLVSKQEKLTEIINSNQINEVAILDKIKQFLNYLYNKFNNLVDYISEGLEKLKEMINEGLEKVLEFFGFDIDVDFNNEIDFYSTI
jgi:hypothetical protein